MESSKTVVFGGSGFLGQALIARLLTQDMVRTTILSVSRNEGELVKLKERFPSIQIMVGDISDAWTVKSAMAGANEVYLLSAMKHVGLAEKEVNACILTNIMGTMNVFNESLNTKPGVLVFISSDKAAQGTGVYGCTKKIGERLMAEAERINPATAYRVIRYGNVWASTGSIATKWKPKMEKGEEVILTDPEASRFFWPVDEAVDQIFECINKATDSTPFVPPMKACKMGTVLEACMEVWGKSPVKTIGLQPGENKIETMDGVTFSDQVEQFTKEEFKEKFLLTGEPLIGEYRELTIGELKEIANNKFTEEDYRAIGRRAPYHEDEIGLTPQNKHPKISCILITREAKYPEIILDRLDQDFFDEILVIANCPTIYDRYIAASKAKNDIIYVQDDDCLVNYRSLFTHYNGQITNAMPKAFIDKYSGTGATLVGWGCFFPKSMVASLDRYIEKYGKDFDLLREADRVFTGMNRPWNTVTMPHEDLFQNEARMGQEPDHYKSMNEALGKVRTLL